MNKGRRKKCHGAAVSDRVDYRPWLAAPPLNAAPSDFLALTIDASVLELDPTSWWRVIDYDGYGRRV